MTRLITALFVSAGGLSSIACGASVHLGDLPQDTGPATTAATSGALSSTSMGAESGETTDGDTESGTETNSSGQPNDDDDTTDADEHVGEARAEFPTLVDLHEKVIKRTCTPFSNVCHNNREYPDLRTPEALIATIGATCNLDKLNEDPVSVSNACESEGDVLRFTDGGNVGHTVEIGRVEVTPNGQGGGAARLFVREPMPAAMQAAEVPESASIERMVGGTLQPMGTLAMALSYAEGATFVDLLDTEDFPANAELLELVTPGDPNADGVYGGTSPGAMQLVAPGDPWNSYLLQRLQGTVPGSPMPLANTPLSAAEMIALACWIEGTADEGGAEVRSTIDYDNCTYATDLLMPPEPAGVSLSGDVQPIFDQSCALSGCHGDADPAGGLNLTAGNARAAMLGVPSVQDPERPLITPVNPTNSYLILKLTGSGASGERMPLDAAPLNQSQIDTVRTWIIQGAPDN